MALPILLIVSLIWLVGGFLADSLRRGEATTPDPPTTRKALITHALSVATILLMWAYMLSKEMRDADGSRFFIGLSLIGMGLTTYLIIRKLSESYKFVSAETSPPEA